MRFKPMDFVAYGTSSYLKERDKTKGSEFSEALNSRRNLYYQSAAITILGNHKRYEASSSTKL